MITVEHLATKGPDFSLRSHWRLKKRAKKESKYSLRGQKHDCEQQVYKVIIYKVVIFTRVLLPEVERKEFINASICLLNDKVEVN